MKRNVGKLGEKYCCEPKIEEITERIKSNKSNLEEIQQYKNLFQCFLK